MGQLDRVVREFFDALNTGDLDAVAAALDPSCDFLAPGFSGHGPDAAVGWMRPFLGAFPGIHHKVLGTVEAADAIAFELEIAGTHTAPLVGPGGEIPRTGRDIRIVAATLWRLSAGRVASYHIWSDQTGSMFQLAPAPGASPEAHAS